MKYSNVFICSVFLLMFAEFTWNLHVLHSFRSGSISFCKSTQNTVGGSTGVKMWIISESDCLLPSSGVVAMEDVTRLVSTGDTVKIWDAASMAPLEQFNPHSITHPVAQACWSSNSILGTGFSFSLWFTDSSVQLWHFACHSVLISLSVEVV